LKGEEEESTSFLKKRSKKLLIIAPDGSTGAPPKVQKFFGSFFQKRTFFLPVGVPEWPASSPASKKA
jgi:hypothetical protein